MTISLSEKVLEILEAKRIKSGGHNGCYIPELCRQTESTFQEIRKILRVLYKEKTITVRDGGHGFLIFINHGKRK